METLRPSPPARRWLRLPAAGAAGAVVGLAAAAVLLLGPASGAVGDPPVPPALDPARIIDATHVPPVLTLPGEPLTLRYDVYCPPPADSSRDECDAAGTVYVRAGDAGPFSALPLNLDRRAGEGRWAARVPPDIARSDDGVSYYAVLRNRTAGTEVTLPAGGAAAPQRAYAAAGMIPVELGGHAFGRTRAATARVFSAVWGDGPADAGLEGGRETEPVGPGSFVVGADGAVTVLDQVHHRALVQAAGAPAVHDVPLDINGTLADLAGGGSGPLWVLETAGADAPMLKEFRRDGSAQGEVPLGTRTAAQLRIGPAGPIVKEYPSEQWVPAVEDGAALGLRAQRRGAEPLRAVSASRQVAVVRAGDEVRVAIVGPGGVERAWRVLSTTPLAEVQLAEPYADGVLLVVRTYTDTRAEFEVVQLGARGPVASFALASDDWAETMPLSRFRLSGSSLYQLGSTPSGVHVDRFDLEVAS
ncbi:MAG TPA: hypothetical protein VFU10_00520 [Gaiellaceae bacterium]|nr:hypothetical protein [Gaiellaceae bacterium]